MVGARRARDGKRRLPQRLNASESAESWRGAKNFWFPVGRDSVPVDKAGCHLVWKRPGLRTAFWVASVHPALTVLACHSEASVARPKNPDSAAAARFLLTRPKNQRPLFSVVIPGKFAVSRANRPPSRRQTSRKLLSVDFRRAERNCFADPRHPCKIRLSAEHSAYKSPSLTATILPRSYGNARSIGR